MAPSCTSTMTAGQCLAALKINEEESDDPAPIMDVQIAGNDVADFFSVGGCNHDDFLCLHYPVCLLQAEPIPHLQPISEANHHWGIVSLHGFTYQHHYCTLHKQHDQVLSLNSNHPHIPLRIYLHHLPQVILFPNNLEQCVFTRSWATITTTGSR
jgi:hypothetical protein